MGLKWNKNVTQPIVTQPERDPNGGIIMKSKNQFLSRFQFLAWLFLLAPVPGCALAEVIDYGLSLGLGRIDINAGTARYATTTGQWKGQKANHIVLSMATTARADKVFPLRDTIQSWNSLQGQGLYYSKTVNEGRKHNFEDAVFKTENGHFTVELTTWNRETGQQSGHSVQWQDERIFDMLSMMEYARNAGLSEKIETDKMKLGQTLMTLPMVNGTMVVDQFLIYEGVETVSALNGKSYVCHKISVRDWKLGKERETMVLYVSARDPHIPVQLEIAIGGGPCIRAKLKNYQE